MSGLSEESIPSPQGTLAVLAVSPSPADRAGRTTGFRVQGEYSN